MLLKEVAAFCAAETMEEKNPVALGVLSPSSVGVKGAAVMLESLLGIIAADPDLLLRCTFIIKEVGLPSTLARGLPPLLGVLFSGDAPTTEVRLSVGVGGVFTMAGADLSLFGGVRGGRVSIMGGIALALLSGEAILAAAGGSSIADCGLEAPLPLMDLEGEGDLSLPAPLELPDARVGGRIWA